MSKIFLISSNTTVKPQPVFPLGMALVASALIHNGHIVRQFDMLFNQEAANDLLEDSLLQFEPDFIGISIRNIDDVDSMTRDWYLKAVKDLVKRIKCVSGKPVILGGSAFSIMPEQILDFTKADFGIVGEGEKAFPDLINDFLSKKKPKKITRLKDKQIKGAEFFSPFFEKELVDFYVDKSGMLNYQTKRGCPFECNYCTYPLIEGRQFRMQDPGFVVQNIMEIKRKFDVHSLFFTDSVFNDSQNYYLEIAEELLRQKCEIKWAAYFRPSKIASDELQLLKKAGLYAMEIGSDAACDTTLQGIGKSFHFESILALNEACVEAEIACAHFFMFGGPGETDQTIAEGLKNIEKLKKCVVFGFSGIRILPGTGIQKIAIDEKIIDKDESLLKPCYYVSPLVEKQKMETDILLAFKKRKAWLFPPSEGEIRMRTLQLFGFKGLIWDMLINFSNTNFKKRNIRTA